MAKRCLGCMETYADEYNICPHCGYVEGCGAEEAIHIVPGVLLHDRYVIGRVIGYGGFGVTYLAWDKRLEQKVAIKEYLPGDFSTRMPGQTRVTVFNGEKREQFHDGLKKFIEEAKKLAKFQNEPGIVKVFDSFEENMTAYIIMEYLEGETLSSFLSRAGKIPEDNAITMLTPVMKSLHVVHEAGILHRDIAPDNIFLTTKGEVKLIDFGASRYATTSHSRSLTVIIKPGYSAEEQYRSRGDQGPHTDVYSLGATLYKMVTGETPVDAMERRANYEKKNKDILVAPHKLKKNISINRENAILNAMNVRIEDRTADISTLLAELNATGAVKRKGSTIRKIDMYSWPLWVKILIPSVLAVILLVGTLIATGVIKVSLFDEKIEIPENMVVVPDVEQMQSDEALKTIKDSGLLVTTGGNVESEFVDVGKIVYQDPIGGTYMLTNSTVTLTVSSGKGVVAAVDGVSTVPFVKWDTEENAIAKLKQAGLGEPIIEKQYNEEVAVGAVIEQSVEAGTKVDEGTVITLYVSMGSSTISVPDVLGQKVTDATRTLEGMGLTVVYIYVKDNALAEDTVKAQDIIGGSVKPGTKITLTVTSGKDVKIVPDVVGMSAAQAESTLMGESFSVHGESEYNPDVPAGSIIRQEPAGGTSQLYGSTVTIYQSMGPEPVYIVFNPCGGYVSETQRTLDHGGTYSNLPTPTRTGYVFAGWYTSPDYSGQQVFANSRVNITQTHTLYAKWEKLRVTVYLNASDGYCDTSSITVCYEDYYSNLPTPTRDGYIFEGWYDGSGNQVTSQTVCRSTQDHTLFARWGNAQVNVTFDARGGTCDYVSMTYNVGESYGSLPVPQNGNKEFLGWYTTSDCTGEPITSYSTVTISQNHTLYAKWGGEVVTVYFDPAGGYCSESYKQYTYGDMYYSLPVPQRDGYTFLGWYTEQGKRITTTSVVETNMEHTLIAYWG